MGRDMSLQEAIETLKTLQFYISAVCLANGQMSRFEKNCINAIHLIVEGANGEGAER